MDLVALAPPWVAVIFVVLMLLAALQDAIQLKISNVLCAALLLCAIIAAGMVGPTWSLWQNAAAFASVLAVGTWLFGMGFMGGGDVKFLAATALWFDLESFFSLLVTVAIAGGLMAAVLILARKFSAQKGEGGESSRPRHSADIPYGVAIAAGAMFTALTFWPGHP